MLLEFMNAGCKPHFDSGGSEGVQHYCLGLAFGCPEYQNIVFKVLAQNDDISYVDHCKQLLRAFYCLNWTRSAVVHFNA